MVDIIYIRQLLQDPEIRTMILEVLEEQGWECH